MSDTQPPPRPDRRSPADVIRDAIAAAPHRLQPPIAACVVDRLTHREHLADLLELVDTPAAAALQADTTTGRHLREAVELAHAVLALPSRTTGRWMQGDGVLWRGQPAEIVTAPPLAVIRLRGSGDEVDADVAELSALTTAEDRS